MTFGELFSWGLWPLIVAAVLLIADRYWQAQFRE
jgi:hypothetical protein